MLRPKKWGSRPKREGRVMAVLVKIAIFALLYGLIDNLKQLRMKRKLLLLLGAVLMMVGNIHAAAPNSYVKFSVNGGNIIPTFTRLSSAVPDPYNLGVVYKMLNEDKPNLGITGYQLVTNQEREGFEYEESHYMLVYIGVYDNNIANGGAYYDTTEEGLYLRPTTSSTAERFGRQFFGGTGSSEHMDEVMSASQFLWSDGMIDNAVLPNPLVYDEATNTYKEGQYQKGHSYVIAIHFTEVTNVVIDNVSSGTNKWEYPGMSKEYTSFNWTDRSKECLLASFTYAGDEAVTTASVMMTVNGEQKQYNLLGENQDPIDLGTIYKKEVTGAHGDQWTLPDLGFESFIVESAVPYTHSEAAGAYGASMTFTTLPKSEADQHIVEGFAVDNRDYKTGDFGRINDDLVPAILCGTEEGLAKLSEDWAYTASPMDVWVNWMYSGTHPVMAGWPLDGAFEDGKTYTVAFYFSEYNDNLEPIFIHRNGGKYYKFNFTYSEKSPDAGDDDSEPLTLEAVEAGTITIKNQNSLSLTYVSSINGQQTSTANPVTIDVATGETIALYCNNTEKPMNFNITSTKDVYIYGNMMSLVFGDNYKGKTDLTGCQGGILGFLFCLGPEGSEKNPTIKNHPTKDILLPATTLSDGCYVFMFSGCNNLTRGPELPAMTLSEDCYHRMFEYTGLTKAPVLPAPTLFGQVYGGMFDHCANLRFVKCLATNITDTSHGTDATTDCWLASVAAKGTFVKAEGVDWSVKTRTDEALNGIPAGWKVYNDGDEMEDDVPGDASGDGVVDLADLVEIVNALAGNPSANYNKAAADLNGDNTVNIADVILLVNQILGH